MCGQSFVYLLLFFLKNAEEENTYSLLVVLNDFNRIGVFLNSKHGKANICYVQFDYDPINR